MFKLIGSAKDSDDLSIRFDQDSGRRRNELTNNENTKGKKHLGIMLKDVFEIAENQTKLLSD